MKRIFAHHSPITHRVCFHGSGDDCVRHLLTVIGTHKLSFVFGRLLYLLPKTVCRSHYLYPSLPLSLSLSIYLLLSFSFLSFNYFATTYACLSNYSYLHLSIHLCFDQLSFAFIYLYVYLSSLSLSFYLSIHLNEGSHTMKKSARQYRSFLNGLKLNKHICCREMDA